MSFLKAFLQSFYSPRSYPALAQRSGWACAGHYLFVILVMSALYGGISALSVSAFLTEELPPLLKEFPEIHVRDGQVSSPVEQPYIVDLDGAQFVLDTHSDPRAYLEEEPAEGTIVLSGSSLIVQKPSGEIREYPLKDCKSADLDQAKLAGWLETTRSLLFPVFTLGVFLWQLFWKLLQTLAVAALLTLLVSGKPGFGTNLKLALHALGPAMGWGVLVFGILCLSGWTVPMAPLGFYAILVGLPLRAARTLQAQEARRAADFVPPQDL